MVKRLGSVILALVVTFVAACGDDKKPPPPPQNFKQKILEGKYSLSKFEAERARAIFLEVNESYRETYKKNHCEASYGVVLADAQVLVTLLNNLVIGPLLTGALSPAPYSPQALPASRGGYRTAGAKPHDFGIELENLWAPKFEPILTEMSIYAAAVTAIADCTFSIGVGDEPVDALVTGENPYKMVLNLGDTEYPIAQLVFRGRLDGAEARLIELIGRSTMALMNFVLAHDLSLTIDLIKIAYILGAPIECIQEDALDCVTKIASGEVTTVPVDFLEAAFIFADNPQLLAKSPAAAGVPQSNRWERRFPVIDNQLARGFFGMRDFFSALLARSAALDTNVASEELFTQYLIFFRDNNEDGKVDAGDGFGINLIENDSGVKLSCDFIIQTRGLTAAQAQECRASMIDAEAFINGFLLTTLRDLFTPSEEAVGEINTFVERVYGNMAAVDNPSITAERIPINQFDNVIRDFFRGLLLDAPTPPFMEFDVKAFFTDPKPLREFLPYWERTTTAWTFSRFIADSDDYTAYSPEGGPPVQLTAPQLLFDQNYWDYSFSLTPTERAVLQGPYDEGRITTLGLPADCLNPVNLHAKLSASIGNLDKVPGTVMYFPLRDPSLNAMIYINMDEWSLRYDGIDNGSSTYGAFTCSDPSGFQLADNQMLTKSMWLYLDFLADHIALTQLLGPILGAIGF